MDPTIEMRRSKSLNRFESIVKGLAKLGVRKNSTSRPASPHHLGVESPDRTIDVPVPSLDSSTLSISSRKASLADQAPVEFLVLPVAPAAFQKRRSADLTVPSMTRRSMSSFTSRKSVESFKSLKNDEEAGGIYGWDEEEAAKYNREYVEFMKTKGVHVSL